MKRNIPNHTLHYDDSEKTDLRLAAFHEAGHLVVAEHYKLKGEAIVARTDGGGLETKCWIGRYTPLQDARLSAYKWAVIGWAGPVAEGLGLQNLSSWREELGDIWCGYEMGDPLSDTDRKLIEQWRNKSEAFRRAASILDKNYAELLSVAETLIRCQYICNL